MHSTNLPQTYDICGTKKEQPGEERERRLEEDEEKEREERGVSCAQCYMLSSLYQMPPPMEGRQTRIV